MCRSTLINVMVDGHVTQSIIVTKVPEEHTGAIVDLLSRRKGEMINMAPIEGGGDTQMSNIEYLVPTRGMIGLRNSMLTATRGTAVMDTVFHSYKPFAGECCCCCYCCCSLFRTGKRFYLM